MSMCMRCGKRHAARNGEPRCTCREDKDRCIADLKHGVEVYERRDSIFPDYTHRICKACGMSVTTGGDDGKAGA